VIMVMVGLGYGGTRWERGVCPVLSGVARKGREREECVYDSNACPFSPFHDEFLR